MFFWAVVSDEINRVIEFFPTRWQAEKDARQGALGRAGLDRDPARRTGRVSDGDGELARRDSSVRARCLWPGRERRKTLLQRLRRRPSYALAQPARVASRSCKTLPSKETWVAIGRRKFASRLSPGQSPDHGGPCGANAHREPLCRTSLRSFSPSLRFRTASAKPCPAAPERVSRTPDDREEGRARGS